MRQTTSTLTPEYRPEYGDLKNFLDGQWLASGTNEWLDDVNPANGRRIARVPITPKEEVDRTVQAAQRAFESWRATPPAERASYLFRLRDLLMDGAEDVARVVVQDMGKTLGEARGEVRRAIENVEVAAGIPSLMMGYNLEDGAAAGIDEEVVHQPLGVFAGISPFNFPAMIQYWFMPYALATGNCWIAKPSELDPLTQSVMFEMVEKAGFPAGVVNLVHGDRTTAEALIDHADVQGVSFVGSTPVAKEVYARASARGKRVQASGGAKNFLVVLPDAKLDRAIPNMVESAYGCAGQRCLAGSVLVAPGREGDEVARRFSEAASALRLGNGLDASTDMGPLISAVARDRVTSFIQKGEEEGASVTIDGRRSPVPDEDGFFVGPTLLDGVAPDMAVAQQEIFGPVMTVLDAPDLDSAIEMINRSRFANAASIYTDSGKAAREFRYRVNAGNVGVNVGVAAPVAWFPFGGAKDSFFGTLHPQGRDAVRFFLDTKVVITRWY